MNNGLLTAARRTVPKHRLFAGSDGIILLAILAALIGFAWCDAASPPGTGRVVITTPAGSMVVAVAPDRRITVTGALGEMVLQCSAGSVRVVAAGCPQQRCRAHGVLGGRDDVIVCVPNQVAIHWLQGGTCDAVTR